MTPSKEELSFRCTAFEQHGDLHRGMVQLTRGEFNNPIILQAIPVHAPHCWIKDSDVGAKIRRKIEAAMEVVNQMYMATTRGLKQ